MLVLSRKPGEEIWIGDKIKVTVVAILGNRVRLGFTAPPEVSIQRNELCPGAADKEALAVVPTSSKPEQ